MMVRDRCAGIPPYMPPDSINKFGQGLQCNRATRVMHHFLDRYFTFPRCARPGKFRGERPPWRWVCMREDYVLVSEGRPDHVHALADYIVLRTRSILSLPRFSDVYVIPSSAMCRELGTNNSRNQAMRLRERTLVAAERWSPEPYHRIPACSVPSSSSAVTRHTHRRNCSLALIERRVNRIVLYDIGRSASGAQTADGKYAVDAERSRHARCRRRAMGGNPLAGWRTTSNRRVLLEGRRMIGLSICEESWRTRPATFNLSSTSADPRRASTLQQLIDRVVGRRTI